MPLMPKRTKHRKMQKGQCKGLSERSAILSTSVNLECKCSNADGSPTSQIEACRVAINRYFQRRGKVWIRIFPDKPVTKKPAEVRMGKGKGAVEHWVAVVRPGRVLFEVANVPREEAQHALYAVRQPSWDLRHVLLNV